MDIRERALDWHKKGYNCAQSVAVACAELAGLDENTAIAVSGGFGGGVRSGEICGAISGAVMAVGAAYPFTDSNDEAAKDKIALFAKECVAVAKEKYGGVRCSELKGNIDCNEIICYMAEYAEKLIKDKT